MDNDDYIFAADLEMTSHLDIFDKTVSNWHKTATIGRNNGKPLPNSGTQKAYIVIVWLKLINSKLNLNEWSFLGQAF